MAALTEGVCCRDGLSWNRGDYASGFFFICVKPELRVSVKEQYHPFEEENSREK